MLLDANILLFAVDRSSPFHERASDWIESALNGDRRVGLPWQTLTAFLRIVTHQRALDRPLTAERAWRYIDDWLESPVTWIPLPTTRHADVLRQLVTRHHLRGNLVADAHLAALAIEHGVSLCSADTDFARFGEIRWVNPISPSSR